MAHLSGLKALLTLAFLMCSAQYHEAIETTSTKPSASTTAAILTNSTQDSQSIPAQTHFTPPSTAAKDSTAAASLPLTSTINTISSDINASPSHTPTPQQNTSGVNDSTTDPFPPRNSTPQHNTTNLNTSETDLTSTNTTGNNNDVPVTEQPIPVCEGRRFDIYMDDEMKIEIKLSDYSRTPGPTTATARVTSPSNTTSPTSSSNPNTATNPKNDVAVTTTAPPVIDGYKIGFSFGSPPQPSEDITGDSFIISTERLKPWTTYLVIVTAIMNGSSICKLRGTTGETFKTRGMKQDDFISAWNDTTSKVCFRTQKWDVSQTWCFPANKTCEVKPFQIDYETMENKNFSVTIHELVPLVDNIELNYSKTIPTNITWKNKPSECQSETLEYNCVGPDQKSYSVEELKPFQEYKCFGTYNKSNYYRQGHEDVLVKCDATVKTVGKVITNTSVKFNIVSESVNCAKVDFSTITICNPACKDSGSRHCDIEGLTPFMLYECKITIKYGTVDVTSNITRFKTEPGRPSNPGHLKINKPSNNVFIVTCAQVKTWNSKSGKYHAQILYGGKVIDEQEKETCNFHFNDLSYSTEYTVKITAINDAGLESEASDSKEFTSYNDKAVIGTLAFFIILTSIALLFVLYKIYILQKRKDNDHADQELIQIPTNHLMTVEPIPADSLLDVYKKKIADEGRLFLAEFQSIPRIFSNYTVKEAKNAENQTKNRYVDILPYDYNRVQLSSSGGEAGSDYINASFIEGFKEQKKYIAAQGPKEETMVDFWRMIWEQKSSIIVMVTRCEEGNRNKCAQYWPSMDRETEIYGDFVLKIKKEELCPDYIIRHLTIINRKDKSSEREVTHIQFTSWPDHGVPSEPHQLLKLRRRVNSFSNFFSGPIVVHCSAGVGRTGTYIGIDAMMESLEAEGVLDIYGYVVKMRRQRCLMVQVEAQYILIHQALIEFNQFGDTEVPLAELHSSITTLQRKDCDESTIMEGEFQRLPKYRNWRTHNTAISEENKRKNRYSSHIPYDFNRVLVKMEEETSRESDHDDDDDDYSSSDDDEEESTQYINASYIDGYWSPKSLIAAQGPLAETIPEFWQMVYQKKVKNIVMLSKCKEGDQEVCAEYWAQEKKTYKDISVEETASVTSPAYIKRTIQLQHAKRKDARQVQQYHFQGWPEQGLPQNPQELVDMIKAMKQTIGSSRAERSVPVVVHCQNGTTRTGIFCALWNLLDSANTENLIDIFQVCKSLRKERQGMIIDFEHYQFLYQAVGGAFPTQNGEVKQTTAPATDSVQIVNEVPTSTTSSDQQAAETPVQAAPTTALEAKKDEAEKEADSATESSSLLPTEGANEAAAQASTANGPTLTVEA